MLIKVMSGTVGTITLAGALLFHQGVVDVKVQEKRADGTNIRLILPAAILPMAVMAVPDDKIRRHAAQLRQVLPALRIAAQELAKCPDTVLVEVQDAREHVRIEKVGGSLVIDVKSPSEDVHISVPLETLDSILSQVQSASARS